MGIVNIDRKALFDGLLHALHSQRDRWGLWLPVPFALGIVAYFQAGFEPAPFAGPVLLAISAALAAAQRKRPAIFYTCLLPVLFSAGLTASQLRTWYIEAPMLVRETRAITLEGVVREVDALPKALRIVIYEPVLVSGFMPPEQAMPRMVRIKLKNKDKAQPAAGDRIRLRAVLLPLSAPVAPSAFDFQRHAFYMQLGATGYAIGDLETLARAERGDFFETLRHGIRQKIESGMQDRETAAIVTAFLIGETKAIPEPTWEIIRASGIAHLLAISGFHITVITGFFFFILRAGLAGWHHAALRWPIKKISAGLSMLAAVFYLQLIGSPIPAERAVIMVCVVMTAIMIDRDPFSLRLAAFAAFVVLALHPEALMGPSFQMSFAAVIALIAFYESAAPRLQARHQEKEGPAWGWVQYIWLYLLACLVTTVVATIATAPFTLFHFGRVPVWSSLVTNMAAVPVSSLVTLPAGMLAIFLMPFGLEGPLLWIVEQSMRLIMATARETAAWPYAVVRIDAFPQWQLALCALGGLWICIWRGWLRWMGTVPVIVAVMLAMGTPRADLLVADNGKLILLRDQQDRLWLSNLRREKFVASAWLEREGSASGGQAAGDWRQAEKEGVLSCDTLGCLFRKNGKTVLIANSAEAVAIDCKRADLFIAPELRLDKELCPKKAALMIDKSSLRHRGAHAVYMVEKEIAITSVNDRRGWRPWVPGFEAERQR